MKTIIIICFLFASGLPKALAQNTVAEDRIAETSNSTHEADARAECNELKEMLQLSEKQEYLVMEVLRISKPKKAYLESIMNITGGDNEEKLQAKKDLEFVKDYEREKFRKIFNEKQMKLYLSRG
ncbi:hypothetical protein M0G43_00255 [Subsaxibacter sp. CAU 1640]|uniref:hypothetical protein n=1 Tax=Subsaxibacter sp. CAU 1640 TaxID=2933271 RepID=UPI002004D7F5|nr:hypothetical protein [Subsaxibacter sp. CAU 1640]MCK7588995.1 hypothetical protein [Subsaxibacter sp. CAU 1640]